MAFMLDSKRILGKITALVISILESIAIESAIFRKLQLFDYLLFADG